MGEVKRPEFCNRRGEKGRKRQVTENCNGALKGIFVRTYSRIG